MECQYHQCEKEATIHVKAANIKLCEGHYLLNILRFGCDLEGEIING